MSDPAVRKAIAMGINKKGFVDVLLKGYGYTATGAFPDSFAFGKGVNTVSYDPEQAKKMAAVSDGVIVGSAIIKLIEKNGISSVELVGEYVKKMKEAVTNI